MSGRRSSVRCVPAWIAAALAVSVAHLSCGRGDGAPAIRSLRLVDRVDEARITSAFDFAAARGGGARVFAGRLAAAPAADVSVHRGDWVAPVLLGREEGAGPLSVRVIQVVFDAPRPLYVSLLPSRPLGADEAAFVQVVPRRLPARALRDVDSLLRVVRRRELVRLLPGEPGQRCGAVVTPGAGTEALLVFVVADPEESATWRLAVRAVPGLQAFAMSAPRVAGSPWVRRVNVAGIVRESLVMAPPCRAAWTLDLPARARRLRARLGLAMSWPDVAVEVSVEVRAGGETRRARARAVDGTWTPLSLDLSGLGGRRAEVVFGGEGGRNVVLLVAQPEVVAEPAGPLPPDVVLVSLDTLRADAVGALGADGGDTPALDALARRAAVFRNAIAAAPWTLPSHVTLLSGQLPDRHGQATVLGRRAASVPWLPALLRARGWRTLAFSSSGYVDPEFGFADGFERYGTIDPAKPPRGWAEARPRVGDVDMLAKAERAARERDRLLERLAAERDRPRFFFVHTYVVHDYRVPPAVLRALGAEDDEMDALLDGVYLGGGRPSPYFRDDLDDTERRRLARRARLLYRGAVRLGDALVGDLVAALEKAGRLDDTILIVTSDHGEELYERGRLGHGHSLFEEQIHVPLLWSGPGVKPRSVADVVSAADVVPTLLASLGIAGPTHHAVPPFDGRDIGALLAGGALEPRAVLARGGGRAPREPVQRVWRGARWKLEETRAGDEVTRRALFDLRADPLETRDRSAEDADLTARLARRLEQRVAALAELAGVAGDQAIPKRLQHALEELGYLGGR